MATDDPAEVPSLIEVERVAHDNQGLGPRFDLIQEREEMLVLRLEDVGVAAVAEVEVGDEVDEFASRPLQVHRGDARALAGLQHAARLERQRGVGLWLCAHARHG